MRLPSLRIPLVIRRMETLLGLLQKGLGALLYLLPYQH